MTTNKELPENAEVVDTDETYDPANDENQGVMTKMIQGETADGGVSQAPYHNPIVNQGPEPEKDEVNDSDEDASGIDENKTIQQQVADGDIDESDDE
ncbi:hypothetical protein CWM47_09635 [Spirosoma pollinicola]|uniref:Uncharacterized protein n=2 Tax=Spirosoma pollinicola TaxID=2057025 RepID=A0A2K8ZBJ1_9BACT|nr:hypothetical protein CWM47_09635 [Spirosoma pollinicola]